MGWTDTNDLECELDVLRDENARLRLNIERWRTIFDGYDNGVVILDEQGHIERANRFVCDIFGLPATELTGKRFDVVFPELGVGFPVTEAIPLEQRSGLWRHAGPEGERCFAYSLHRIGNGAHYCRFHDITDRIRQNERLRLLEKAIEQSRDVVIITQAEPFGSPGPQIVYVNSQFTRQTGYTVEEAIGNTPRMLQGPKSDRTALDGVRRALEAWEPVEAEVLNYRKDGTEFWAQLNIAPVADETGHFTHWVSVQRDITERRRFQTMIEENERRYRGLFEQLPQFGILGFNERHEVTFWNDSCEKIYGYSRDQALGRRIEDLMCNNEEKPEMAGLLNKWFQENMVDPPSEMVVRRCDGSPVTVYSSHSFHNTPRGPEVYCLDFDMTDLKQREEERLKISRLESLGVLAGGIAHDFNNLLMAICGNVELMKRHAPDGSSLREKLNRIEKAGQRASRLARELLTFAKGGEPRRTRVGLPELVEDSMTFVLHGSNIANEISLPKNLWEVLVDEGQITQALQNLAVNAREAMSAGGTLSVRAENIRVGESSPIPLEAGDYVRVTVRDTGCGIPPEYLDRVFDPYFTTKESGSGLGLAVTFSVIRRNGGHISVQSEPGAGTTFFIYLPARGEGDEDPLELPPTARPKTLDEATGRPLRILVMDDETAILEMACEMLEGLGFATERATNGEDALVHYIRGWVMGYPFAAVILDLTVVGGMGGVEAMTKLRAFDPFVKAIMCSGYAEGDVLQRFADFGFAARLNKPYLFEDLEITLAQVIGVETESGD